MEMITEEEKKILHDWYNDKSVKFEIIKTMKFKEFQIIWENKKQKDVIIRWLKPFSLDNYDAILKWYRFDTLKANMYRSLEMYKIPNMSFVPNDRNKQMTEWKIERNGNPDTFLGGDLGFDLDAPDKKWGTSLKDARILKNIFDKYGLRYSMWMSGEKGFHFILPFEDMPDEIKSFDRTELLKFYKGRATEFQKDIKTLDISNIYMPTRVFKCPYTIHKNMKLIFPLDDETFNYLEKGVLSLNPKDIINNYRIGYRGIFLQKETNENKWKQNLDIFFRETKNGIL